LRKRGNRRRAEGRVRIGKEQRKEREQVRSRGKKGNRRGAEGRKGADEEQREERDQVRS
jgi:hypothetical protein